MDNAPVNPSQHDDEEYQFSEDDSASQYGISQGKERSTSSVVEEGMDEGHKSSTKKRLLIIVGVIIGIFCLYKLYGLFTTPSSSVPVKIPPSSASVSSINTQPKTAIQTPVAPALTSNEDEKKTLEPMPPVLSEKTVDKEEIKQKVSTLEKAVVENEKSQENLQNEIAGVTSAITEIQSNIAMLTQQINTLVQQKNEAEAKLAMREKEKITPKEKEKEKEKEQIEVMHKKAKKTKKTIYPGGSVIGGYYIKALIQGRAWLINTNGATSTVSVGDQLPGYGQIQEINPSTGIVTTSSGRVISFMPQDR